MGRRQAARRSASERLQSSDPRRRDFALARRGRRTRESDAVAAEEAVVVSCHHRACAGSHRLNSCFSTSFIGWLSCDGGGMEESLACGAAGRAGMPAGACAAGAGTAGMLRPCPSPCCSRLPMVSPSWPPSASGGLPLLLLPPLLLCPVPCPPFINPPSPL